MGEQHRVTEACDLLDERGHLVEPGYATAPLWRYDRAAIRASRLRIKEWDYYAVLAPDAGHGLTVTVADLGFLGLVAVCWLDLERNTFAQADRMRVMPLGQMGLSSHSGDGRVEVDHGGLRLALETRGETRTITVDAPDFEGPGGQRGLRGSVDLHHAAADDAMVIATSWAENRRAFYYNHKVNAMPATGSFELGGETHEFDPANSFGTLDWGRGNWTYRNRWYWGSASGLVQGRRFGFNIGYGFSDRSVASENMLFVDGRAHKLGEVIFDFDPDDVMRPWRFTSDDGRFEAEMAPRLDRNGKTDLGLLRSIQHQVFGDFTGEVVLDDGEILRLDGLLGFAEDVLNWW